MKILLVLLAFIPLLLFSQSKKKKAFAELQARAALTAAIKSHLQYLSDDKLEGRRTGTKGEALAMDYIVAQYKQAGILPKGINDSYIQPFEINEGKQISSTSFLEINNQQASINDHYFPLAYTANKMVKSNVAVSLNESGNIWFRDLKDWLEDNQNNPHYNIEDAIKKYITRATSRGATGLCIYNTSSIEDNLQFNKYDTSFAATIPILYITKAGMSRFFKDLTATQTVKTNVLVRQSIRPAHNIVAFLDNNAPNTVIIGAHYDHLGFGEDNNALDTGTIIHNGADDNASGTAAVIELAKQLKTSTAKCNNYLFIHFSAEELGLLGSKYWIQHPTISTNINYMINLDMVGRYDTAKKLMIGGYGTSSTWAEVIKATTTKDLKLKLDSSGTGPSDHATFYRNNTPVLFFFTGTHSDYHKSTDDCDKINYEATTDIVNYIQKVIASADSKGKLSFCKTAEASSENTPHFTVTLGVIPDYSYTGTGVRIDGVSPNKQAERIGLQAGDILLQLGSTKFADLQQYMEALSKFKHGDDTQLIIKRGNEEKAFDVHF